MKQHVWLSLFLYFSLFAFIHISACKIRRVPHVTKCQVTMFHKMRQNFTFSSRSIFSIIWQWTELERNVRSILCLQNFREFLRIACFSNRQPNGNCRYQCATRKIPFFDFILSLSWNCELELKVKNKEANRQTLITIFFRKWFKNIVYQGRKEGDFWRVWTYFVWSKISFHSR